MSLTFYAVHELKVRLETNLKVVIKYLKGILRPSYLVPDWGIYIVDYVPQPRTKNLASVVDRLLSLHDNFCAKQKFK